MALRFFWRCEDASDPSALTAGVDYSVGDTSGAKSGAVAIGTTGAKVGTNGIYTTDGLDYYVFDCTSTAIVLPTEGAIGFWFQAPTTMPSFAADIGVSGNGVAGSTTQAIVTRVASQYISLRVYDDAGSSNTVTATGTAMAAGTWYFCVYRWDLANDNAAVEVYTGTSETPIQSGSAPSTFTVSAPSALQSSAGLRVGNKSSITSVMYFDNVFVADDYDEPLHLYGNRDITDVDSYTASAATKYVKLLAHSSAASATDVEGVVLNAARDTVIGEFTGQSFEASLEGSPGEAVLLIPVADITPDGSTLTTSDTPIVFAYNATYGTVGEGSATVVEV